MTPGAARCFDRISDGNLPLPSVKFPQKGVGAPWAFNTEGLKFAIFL
jgi:hypothetical protein